MKPYTILLVIVEENIYYFSFAKYETGFDTVVDEIRKTLSKDLFQLQVLTNVSKSELEGLFKNAFITQHIGELYEFNEELKNTVEESKQRFLDKYEEALNKLS